MNLKFWKHKRETEILDEIEREAAAVHSDNITKLRENRQVLNNLKQALEENNIIFQLAHVTGGHKK